MNLQDRIAATEISFRENGIDYSPADLVDIRRDDAAQQVREGLEWITLKVPSGSEVRLHATVVVHFLGRNRY